MILAVINEKGGSTKTTTTVNTAAALAAEGKRVRIIDADPQAGSATYWLPPKDNVGEGLVDVFRDKSTIDDVTSRTAVDNLYIVPSWTTLREVERTREPGSELVLRSALATSEAPIDVDIIDSPHTLDVLAVAAVAAAEGLIVPVQASGLDVVGMEELLEMVKTVRRRINPDLRISAIVVGRAKAIGPGRYTAFDQQLIDSFRAQYPDSLVAPIADSVRMREATEAHIPINLYEPNGRCAGDFASLASGLIQREEAV
ncbi:ParA family protein [Micromonospora aurantiaca (nom. illeg.)]|uniref:ParA family protein n=1 Tax=Micromonospora aurantiaca (nom. illeg.) TaxID=47850 RepID=UPI0011AD6935|nr:AAA family ATPase [Micromonospora aurantiaca]MBC9000539.1 AAA family ATPase [Micromonospora aurantiaca]